MYRIQEKISLLSAKLIEIFTMFLFSLLIKFFNGNRICMVELVVIRGLGCNLFQSFPILRDDTFRSGRERLFECLIFDTLLFHQRLVKSICRKSEGNGTNDYP